MIKPRFLQIHSLNSYSASLLNRDDSGLAKRLLYGGTLRTRISSQCLKRHWRMANDPHALNRITEAESSIRSRDLVTQMIINPLTDKFPKDVLEKLEPEIQKAVYGEKGGSKKSRQTLLLGNPEIRWLKDEVEKIAEKAGDDPKQAEAIAKDWAKDFNKNIKIMREQTTLHAGLESALFGRMVTSDPNANITAPVHVAHSFTIHSEETESDYFTAVDDLSEDQQGADTIQETELTSGIFYGYTVVDIPSLLNNLGGDITLAGKVLYNLVYLIAEVSPGAKLGSTAPFSRATLVLLEAGDRQPRSLAEAYRKHCQPQISTAITSLKNHLINLDEAYSTEEERRILSLENTDFPRAIHATLKELGLWAKDLPNRVAK